jgi:hypothetical protein
VIQESLWFTKGSEGQDFQASSGWLGSFTSRCLIPQKRKSMSGESNGVSQVVVNTFKEIISDSEEKYIFSVEDCELLFQAMADKTLATKGDKYKRGKHSEERWTVLEAASVTCEKTPTFMISTAHEQRCYKMYSPGSSACTVIGDELDTWGLIPGKRKRFFCI